MLRILKCAAVPHQDGTTGSDAPRSGGAPSLARAEQSDAGAELEVLHTASLRALPRGRSRDCLDEGMIAQSRRLPSAFAVKPVLLRPARECGVFAVADVKDAAVEEHTVRPRHLALQRIAVGASPVRRCR